MTSIEKVFELLEKKGDMRETTSIRNLQLNIDTSDYLELKRLAKEMHRLEIEEAQSYAISNADNDNRYVRFCQVLVKNKKILGGHIKPSFYNKP